MGEPVVAVKLKRSHAGTVGLAVSVMALLAALVLPAVAHGKGEGRAYEPPYKLGPSGGDEFNMIEADPDSGNISILRLFPGIPPVVGCEPEPAAGWAMFQTKHKVTGSIGKVTVAFSATLDAYSWITVGAREANGDWLGVKKLQGPLNGEGELTAELFERPRPGTTITLEFGLQLGDACPQAGGATASFPSVSVR